MTGERYELRDELARGGGGRVVRAFDRKLGREVAIKFPHDDADGVSLEQRLEREARILAGLEHPAIVPIHDAGTWRNGRPYFAMRLLGGRTLKDAMRAADGFDARLALLPMAEAIADAVAYAHGRGVIHRDLKPTNVLVGELGDTVVIDWGLAKQRDDAASEASEVAVTSTGPRAVDDGAPRGAAVAAGTDDTAIAALTATGAVMGTPAYMAPEQARGEPADARTDVYAIGVILYELLAGVRPHEGHDTLEVAEKILAGPPPPLDEREPRVRRELVAIVEKAMAREPRDRYRDAGALAEDLRRYQAGRLVAAYRYSRLGLAGRWLRRRAALLLAAVALVAIGVATASALSSQPAVTAADRCRDAARPAAERWNADVTARVAAAFGATGLPHAPGVFAVVRPQLDAQASRIGAMRIEACLAHARGEQSGEALDLRMTCLDLRLGQLEAVIAALAAPDAAVINGAPRMVVGMGRVDDCADLDVLAAVTPLPDDVNQRMLLAQLRARLDRIQVELDAARLTGPDTLDEVVAQARALGYAPLTALALQRAGGVRRDHSRADRELAEAQLRESVLLAEIGGDDRARLGSTVQLYTIVGKDRAREREGQALVRQAEALARRTGAVRELAFLRSRQGSVAYERGEYEAAIARGREAVALLEAMPSPPKDVLVLARHGLAAALVATRRIEEALVELDRVEALAREIYGDTHENLAKLLDSRASALAIAGRIDEAIALYQRVLAMHERIAPGGEPVAKTLINLGNVLNQIDREPEAIAAFERAMRVIEALHGREHHLYASTLTMLADAYSYHGDHARALEVLEEALALANRTLGEADPATTSIHYRIAEQLRAFDRVDEAIAAYEATLALMDRRAEPNLERAFVLGGLATAYGLRKRWRDAIATYERALPLLEQARDESNLAHSKLGLADALEGAGIQHPRALALAREARAVFAAGSDAQSAMLLRMTDAWLGEHDR